MGQNVECGVCHGSGRVTVQVKRVVKDKDDKQRSTSESVQQDCKGCRGSGVVPS